MTAVLIRGGKRRSEIQRHRAEGHMKRRVEIGGMHLQAKDGWQPPDVRREPWNGFFLVKKPVLLTP